MPEPVATMHGDPDSPVRWLPTDELHPHPVSQSIYRESSVPDDFLEDIRANGILEPLVVKSDGKIVSGHRRWRAAQQLKIESVPVRVVNYLTLLDERMAVISFNRQREKTFSQRMAEAEEIKTIEEERSRLRMLVGKTIEPHARICVGSKGETRQKVGIASGLGSRENVRKAEKVWEMAQAGDSLAKRLVARLDGRDTTIDRAFKEIELAAELAERKAVDARRVSQLPAAHQRYRLICSDIKNLDLPPDSADTIVTDPPYAKESLPLYEDLAKLAVRVLKPGALILVMTGQIHLPRVLDILCSYLDYHWTMAHLLAGPYAIIPGRVSQIGWKPIICLSKGPSARQLDVDVIMGEGADKRYHPHGQCVSGFEQLVGLASRPGDRVLDPFCGGGTTGEAALLLGRTFVGSDTSSEAIRVSSERLACVAEALEQQRHPAIPACAEAAVATEDTDSMSTCFTE